LRRQSFYSLPYKHIDILSEPPFSLPEKLDAVDKAIDANADIAEAMLDAALESFGLPPGKDLWHGKATPSDLDKARSTLRQLYRDWSEEGRAERLSSFTPIMVALQTHLPPVRAYQRHLQHILVPGAGLGRLLFDICRTGYSAEGNEISYHQLIASNYILNSCSSAGKHDMHPWAYGFSNHSVRSDQLRKVSIPDIHPATELQDVDSTYEVPFGKRMSMTAGDFSELYRSEEQQNRFDAVVTCFFIDTAPNLIQYIETVKNCLKTDGLWINNGPLLWHFEASPTPAEKHRDQTTGRLAPNSERRGIAEYGSFELSHDEVIALVERFGFEMVECKQAPGGVAGYVQDPASMLQNVYRPELWVARKI
jgi:carnosine N-methyltransferase